MPSLLWGIAFALLFVADAHKGRCIRHPLRGHHHHHHECRHNPCSSAVCEAWPTATCSPNKKTCKAEWYLNGALVNCEPLCVWADWLPCSGDCDIGGTQRRFLRPANPLGGIQCPTGSVVRGCIPDGCSKCRWTMSICTPKRIRTLVPTSNVECPLAAQTQECQLRQCADQKCGDSCLGIPCNVAPNATCSVNTTTCEAEWRLDGQKISCEGCDWSSWGQCMGDCTNAIQYRPMNTVNPLLPRDDPRAICFMELLERPCLPEECTGCTWSNWGPCVMVTEGFLSGCPESRNVTECDLPNCI